VRAAAGGRRPAIDPRSPLGAAVPSYGLSTPALRGIWKRFHARLVELSVGDRVALAELLVRDRVHDLEQTGIHVLTLCAQELEPEHGRRLDRFADEFQGWAHVDHFCAEVMQPFLQRHPQAALTLIEKWNRSPNRWKRRASVVTFTRKVGRSGAWTRELLRLCDNLIWDPEDLVQKGVGWALKDNLRASPGRVLPYVKELRRKGVSSTITLYAIRGLAAEKRRQVLSVRGGRASAPRPRGSRRVGTGPPHPR
jgi:3-methyladenine DNA glycosylase AlkD